MKKSTKRALPFWIILGLVGAIALTLSFFLPIPGWLTWTLVAASWGGCILWILVHILAGTIKKSKGPHAFTGNQMLYQRYSSEFSQALDRYLETVRRKGFLKSSALYERPWYLLVGPRQSGKSMLLKGSNLHFPVRYPSEKDGLFVEGAEQISWYFGNESVWVDTPGGMVSAEGAEEWKAAGAALARLRPERPMDGLALVISAPEILHSSPATIREIAQEMRSRIDELISSWGIEFPVYLIFNRMDEVPGFMEYFYNKSGKWHEQVLGATLSGEQQHMMPRQAFVQEYQQLCASLASFRMSILSMEKNATRRRMLCRFVIHFEGMQEKLASFVTELFKPSNYEGKPLFRGFYFTACRKTASTSDAAPEPEYNVSQTIANHPLNPHRAAARESAPRAAGSRESIRAFFVAPLFAKIMGRDQSLVKRTQKRSRKEMTRHYGLAAAIMLVTALGVGWMHHAATKSRSMLDEVRRDLQGGSAKGESFETAYRQMGRTGTVVQKLKRYEGRGAPFSMQPGFYRGETVLQRAKKEYFNQLRQLVVSPAIAYLEWMIKDNTQTIGELSADQHSELYRSLKGYLSLSEAIADRYDDLDTAFLRPVLIEAVTRYALNRTRRSRLPADIEAILNNNMGTFLHYLKNREFPLIQSNQRLVAMARRRLRRLPDARNLYETIANRMANELPAVTLDDVLGRSEPGILQSDQTISSLYSQAGWDQYMAEAIAEASKNPFQVDWVIGMSESDASRSALDPSRLQSDMVAAYFTDYELQWREFLEAVHLEPFGDLQRSGRLLRKYMGEQSELVRLLEAVVSQTQVVVEDKASQMGKDALEKAGKFKKTKKMAQKMQKRANAFSFNRKSPSDELAAAYDPLRSFVRSSGASLGGLEGYRDHIMSLAEKISSIEERGESHAITVFDGGEEDPLLGAWKFASNTLDAFPEDLAEACKALFISPVEYVGQAASRVLTEKINERWQDEVVKVYTSRFAGRYPFNPRGDEASFSDVMDFFRPATGTFWGFYKRVLSTYIIKNGASWNVRTLGSVNVAFNQEIYDALYKAERIRDMFFKPDGTLRTLNISFSPVSSNKYPAVLDVGGQSLELTPGGRSGQIRWPQEAGMQGASLKIKVSEDFTQDISYNGNWAFMKLLEASRINKLNQSSFTARWQTNVQNMYMIYLSYKVRVSGADHPFSDHVFAEFDCPVELTLPPEPALASDS